MLRNCASIHESTISVTQAQPDHSASAIQAPDEGNASSTQAQRSTTFHLEADVCNLSSRQERPSSQNNDLHVHHYIQTQAFQLQKCYKPRGSLQILTPMQENRIDSSRNVKKYNRPKSQLKNIYTQAQRKREASLT
jgi:hypothetical protein